MTFLLAMHARLLFTILFVFGVLMLWALVLWARGAKLGRYFQAGLSIGVLLVLAEFVIGVLVFLNGARPARVTMHIVYGVVALVTVPVARVFLRGRTGRHMPLVFAFVCLFVCAIALRGLATAR